MTTLLGLVALVGLKPWEADSADPHLSPLGFKASVGGSVAVATPKGTGGVDVAVAKGVPVRFAGDSPANRTGGLGGDTVLAVSEGRAVDAAGSGSAPSPPAEPAPAPEAQPIAAPAPEIAPAPGTAPTVASTDEAPQGGPVTAGVEPELGCEGDEYTITVTFEEESESGEAGPADILLRRFGEDGSSDELQLEGDLSDAQSLATHLASEGNCVEVQILQPEDGTVEEATEIDPTLEPIPR